MWKLGLSCLNTANAFERKAARAADWKRCPIDECEEGLVPLGPLVKPGMAGFSVGVYRRSIYYGERFAGVVRSPYEEGELPGALLTPFLREGAAASLARSADYLRAVHGSQYALLIWDAYRPLEVQAALYNDLLQQFQTKLARELSNAGASAAEAEEKALVLAEARTQVFVSLPSVDPKMPSPHSTGGAVDATIIEFEGEVLGELEQLNQKVSDPDLDGLGRASVENRRTELMWLHSRPLDTGVKFDQVAAETRADFYESGSAGRDGSGPDGHLFRRRREARRMLCEVMQRGGFSAYEHEPWHFDRGNQMGAVRTGQNVAIYGRAALSGANNAWENERVLEYRQRQEAFNCLDACRLQAE